MKQLVSFNQVVRLEPRLRDLDQQASQIDGTTDGFCANKVWCGALKPILVALVGWEAAHPLLQSEASYDCAYEHIYARLPDCRHESTMFCV